MTTTTARNALMNPAFRLWDYGESLDLAALPAVPYAATRWKVAGGTAAGTIAKGTTPTGSTTDKWVRGVDALTATITTAGTCSVTQTIENGVRIARGLHTLSVVAFGPAGGSFTVEAAGVRGVLKTTGGVNPDVLHLDVFTGDIVGPDLPVTIFKDPGLAGTYQVVFVQLLTGIEKPARGPFHIPTITEERARCARYCVPVTSGELVHGNASSAFLAPRFDMRVAPSFIAHTTVFDAIQIRSGAAGQITSANISTSNVSTTGARVSVQGTATGFTATEMMMTTPRLGVFHADF